MNRVDAFNLVAPTRCRQAIAGMSSSEANAYVVARVQAADAALQAVADAGLGDPRRLAHAWFEETAGGQVLCVAYGRNAGAWQNRLRGSAAILMSGLTTAPHVP